MNPGNRQTEKGKHMASTSTYLNFARSSEEAFNFYKSVFETEFNGQIVRFGDIPPQEGQPPMDPADSQLIMNIQLPITGGHILMATDAPESMGFTVTMGNNSYISVHPDTKGEADTLFRRLSAGGEVEMAMEDQFWGDYFGSLTDKFEVRWMVNCMGQQ